eukprot:scaffold96371_cov19-Tisochrysis_lutea.AAC.1
MAPSRPLHVPLCFGGMLGWLGAVGSSKKGESGRTLSQMLAFTNTHTYSHTSGGADLCRERLDKDGCAGAALGVAHTGVLRCAGIPLAVVLGVRGHVLHSQALPPPAGKWVCAGATHSPSIRLGQLPACVPMLESN